MYKKLPCLLITHCNLFLIKLLCIFLQSPIPVYTDCINRPTTCRQDSGHRDRLCSRHGCRPRCANVFVSKKFLYGANIITGLKQVRSKGVTECVATSVLDNTRFADCFLDGPLKNRLVGMMSPFFTGLCVLPSGFLWEGPLPAPFLRCIGIFAIERARHLNTPPSFGQVFLMDRLDFF